MDTENIMLNSTESLKVSTSFSLGKIILYGAQIIFIVQLLMAILNYSRDWKNDNSNKINSEISTTNNDSESVELKSSDNSISEIIETSTFSLKKILSFISVLPLSSFYLILKLSYNIIKFTVYTIFDFVIDFVIYWILNFPERFEEYVISFINNYVFRGISYISETYLVPVFSHVSNKIKTFFNEVFTEENYDMAVFYIERYAEDIYDNVIVPWCEKISDYLIKFSNVLWNFTKEYSVKAYAFGKLVINTLTIFTLDFFEDVQVAWSGIQWFGINIAQPAASFLEDVLLTMTIRPLAYSLAFLKVFIEKSAKLTYKFIIGTILFIPTIFSMLTVFIYKTFNIDALKHRVHEWMCRWVYLPLWYVADFLINCLEKIVIDYIPKIYNAFIKMGSYFFSKLVSLYNITMEYLKLGIYYIYQFAEKAFNFIVEFIPYAHKKSMKLSKKIYNWMKVNIFPWFDTVHHIFYVIPLNMSKKAFALVGNHVFSENSFIGKNSRILMRSTRHLGEVVFSHMIQAGQVVKTSLISMLKVIMPHVVDVSKKIIIMLKELSLNIYVAIKPICMKEMDIMAQWAEKEFNQFSIFMKNLLKELSLKIQETATLIHQNIISENKKLHQSYENKKEFNKEFLHKND
jgi:hypothetical protein